MHALNFGTVKIEVCYACTEFWYSEEVCYACTEFWCSEEVCYDKEIKNALKRAVNNKIVKSVVVFFFIIVTK